MQNILTNAVNLISGLVANQQIELLRFVVVNRGGFSMHELKDEMSLWVHIQPITPAELKKYTDSTLDSTQTYKIFASGADADILSSAETILCECMVRWRGKYYKIFGKRDWLNQNGWIAFYVTLAKDFKLQKGDQNENLE